MKCRLNVIALLAGCMILTAGKAHATNITISDGVAGSDAWYGGTSNSSIGREDNEVEPGMVQGQQWDLEAFMLEGESLTIVGGYNFFAGEAGMAAGDIFIDTNGDAVYSPNAPAGATIVGNTISNSYYNYDYVLDINWSTGTYDVVKLAADQTLILGIYGTSHNWLSNPWQYGGDGKGDDVFSSEQYLGLNGDGHYTATFDISSLDLTNGAIFHNTMQCGNDNLIGKVPEPSTLLLLGSGLLGLAGLTRRKKSC